MVRLGKELQELPANVQFYGVVSDARFRLSGMIYEPKDLDVAKLAGLVREIQNETIRLEALDRDLNKLDL